MAKINESQFQDVFCYMEISDYVNFWEAHTVALNSNCLCACFLTIAVYKKRTINFYALKLNIEIFTETRNRNKHSLHLFHPLLNCFNCSFSSIIEYEQRII